MKNEETIIRPKHWYLFPYVSEKLSLRVKEPHNMIACVGYKNLFQAIGSNADRELHLVFLADFEKQLCR